MLRTGARVVQELSRLACDQLSRSGGLRRRAAELDAATLSGLLGGRVTSVTDLGGTTGTTDRARLGLTGVGVPESVFVKTAAVAPGTRLFGRMARLGEVEVGFYDTVRPGLEVEAPLCLGAAFHPRTGRFVLVLEDLAARDVEFVDTRTPLTADRAAQALTTLAGLHGPTHGRLPGAAWLGTNSEDPFLPLISRAMPRLARRVGERDATLLAARSDVLLRDYAGWAPTLDEGPHCLLHGDPHPGNLYLLPDRVGLLDWQAVRLGNPQRDASYTLILGLPTELRRSHERDLLDHYRGELAAAGGPDRTLDETWEHHRRMAAYPYLSAVFTVGLGGLQGDDVASVGVRRAAAAVDDLESIAALGL